MSGIKYKKICRDGEQVVCECCGCEAPVHQFVSGDRPQYYCYFCSSTLASTYSRAAERRGTDEFSALRAEIWKAAACVFNKLKEEI